MPVGIIERVGRNTNNTLAAFGDFFVLCARTFAWLGAGVVKWKNLRLLFPQMYEVGVRSVPVVSVTGAFIGMVLAIESFPQFKAIGQEYRLGTVINLSVVKQITARRGGRILDRHPGLRPLRPCALAPLDTHKANSHPSDARRMQERSPLLTSPPRRGAS